MAANERPLTAVPWPLALLLVAALAAQVNWASTARPPAIQIAELPVAPSEPALDVLSLGEPEILARVLMLWLQAFDYQPGVSISFKRLDYARVEQWLERILKLDPAFDYPLLAAARLYGEVDDARRQRRMLKFIARHFADDPARRWPWMAHAVYLAKHRLDDHTLALELARQINEFDHLKAIPAWARQLHIFVLEDMGEIEAARILLGGLLESGKITDPHEQWFLSQRLAELEEKTAQQTQP